MPPNPLWDALAEAFGYSPMLRSEQKLWGKIVSELVAGGVTPDQVRRAHRGYRKLYPQAALTPTSLLKHFSASLAEVGSKPRLRAVAEEDVSQEATVPPPPGLVSRFLGSKESA